MTPPATTALGSLLAYVTQRGRKEFQPMNANYGLFPPLAGRVARTREEAEARRTRARRLRPVGDRGRIAVAAGAAPTAVATHEALPL